ncbi:hypothetical protein GmHk_04G011043 [Glycine max]|nr:hypothetical protein GmHk_04G011043 [Glycine max]
MCCGRSGGRWFFRGWQRKKVLPRDSEEEPSSTRRKWNIFDTRGRRFFCGNPRKKLLPRVSRTLHFLLAEDGSSAAIRGRSFFHGSARMKVLPPVSAEEDSLEKPYKYATSLVPRVKLYLIKDDHLEKLEKTRWGQIVVYVRPERVIRQFGYIPTVPPPSVSDSLTDDDIDDQWLHFSDHLVGAGEICVVLGQVAPDYMDWFFRISHPFVTPTEETAEPRHHPLPHVEEFVKPPIPEVSVASDLPTHSVVDCQGCAAIAEELERVINLKMVTEGTDLYDIMARCLRIARGDAADKSLRPR